MKRTLFFSAVICMLLSACKYKIHDSIEQIFETRGGTITKVTVLFVETLPNGKDTIVNKTNHPQSKWTSEHMFVEIRNHKIVYIKLLADFDLDINRDGKSDTTVRYPYDGERIGDQLFSNQWHGNGVTSDTASLIKKL